MELVSNKDSIYSDTVFCHILSYLLANLLTTQCALVSIFGQLACFSSKLSILEESKWVYKALDDSIGWGSYSM